MCRVWLIVALVTALSGFVPALNAVHSQEQDQSQNGINAFAEGDYHRAANIWLVEAYEGSLEAQFNLGVLYLEGKGVAQNREDAVFWFTKAAQGGHVEAQYNLGHLYFENQDDAESLKQGMDWWQRASLQEYSIAQYNYGRALFFGIGAAQDLQKSRYWMERSAAAGTNVAIRFLTTNSEVFSGINATEDAAVIAHFNDMESAGRESTGATEPARSETKVASSGSGDAASTRAVNRFNHYFVVSSGGLQPVFSRHSSEAPVLTQAQPGLLLRGDTGQSGWTEVQVPAGFPGWISADRAARNESFIEISAATASIFADPAVLSEQGTIGQVSSGTYLLVIGENDGFYQVLTPESITGWIRTEHLTGETGTEIELAKRWLNQRLVRKDRALASASLNQAEFAFTSFQQDLDTPSKIEELMVDEFVAQLEAGYNPFADRSGLQDQSSRPSGNTDSELLDSGDESVQYAAQFTQAQLDDLEPVRIENPGSDETGFIATGIDNDNAWLYSRDPEFYTLMLFSNKDRNKALALYKGVIEQGQLFSTVSDGKRWYYIILGSFSTKVEAETELANLPMWARSGAARLFGSLQNKRCEKLDLLDNYESHGLVEFCRI